MASKARKLVKEKEKYLGFQDYYKKLRKWVWWSLVGISLACAFFVVIGIYSGKNVILGCASAFILPFAFDIYYIIQYNRKIKEYDLLVVEVDNKQEVWIENLNRLSNKK